jgi:c-di-GMP-binding flagellar brake protein YcgR
MLVEVEVGLDGEGLAFSGVFVSRVREAGTGTVVLEVPDEFVSLLPRWVGREVRVVFGQESIAYSFSSRATGWAAEPVPQLHIATPGNIVQRQRRSFARLDIALPVQFHHVASRDRAVCGGRTVDISGGGILFHTREEVKPRDLLVLRLLLPEREPLVLLARVLRVVSSRKGDHVVATRFVEIEEAQREQIVSFIFERQNRLMSRKPERLRLAGSSWV